MTRDDAYARAVELNSEVYPYGVDTGTLIEEIYDDFESRTCSTCKYMSVGVGHMEDMSYCNADDTLVDAWQDTIEMNDFGCNKFEPK